MKNAVSSLCLFFTSLLLAGQSDPQANAVLDKFSSVALSSPSVSIRFTMITVDQAAKTSDTVSGSLIMAKDQYKLEMPDNITWFNGSVSWNLLTAEKEVTVTKPDRRDDSFINRPSSIFTLYKKGYKTKLLEEKASSYLVDLYPEDVKSDLVRIRLTIGKSLHDLAAAEYKRKDGITVYLAVSEYNLKLRPDPSTFTFNQKDYKGVEVIDMR